MPNTSYRPVLLLLAFLLFFSMANAQQIKPVLLNKVDSLPLPQKPDEITAFLMIGDEPEIIAIQDAIDWNGNSIKIATIAASNFGDGKIIGIGAPSYFRADMLNNNSVAQLMKNIMGLTKTNSAHLKAAIAGKFEPGLELLLKQQKADVYETETLHIKKGTNLLFLNRDVADDAQLKQLEHFVTTGGTLVFASPFSDYNNGKAGTEYSKYEDLRINMLLGKAGMSSVNIFLSSNRGHQNLITDSIPYYLNIKTLLPALANNENMGAAVKMISDYTVSEVFRHSDYHSPIVEEIKKINGVPSNVPVPSPANPVLNNTPELKRVNKLAYQLYDKQQNFIMHPNAKYIGHDIFPGAVPDNAKRVSQTMTIKLHVGSQGYTDNLHNVQMRLHPTGLYIPAGERVIVTIKDADIKRDIGARIGMHNDDVTNVDQFTRYPLGLTKDIPLRKKETEIYSPFGGLLLISAPDTSTLKEITVNIKGAVKAPYFKLGETDEKEWIKSIRNNPAPWAELATDNIVLTVPSARIRKLDNPVKLMQFWDEVMNADADLAQMPQKRKHWEQIIVDNDVAHAYMFTTLDRTMVPDDQSCAWMLDEAYMRLHGSWGTLHELGHRHQYWPFEDSSTQEVTVNLYTTYIYDKVLHQGIYHHEGMESHAEMLAKINAYLSSPASGYIQWRQDPFLALAMYLQLVENFGWDAIKAVNTTYRNTPKDQFPLNERQKLDFRFITLCKATNSNLSRFFEVWKIPVSDAAKKYAENYKPWFPDELAAYK